MKRQRGFSLIELTVWLVLFSLLATTTLATLILTVRAWCASTDRVHVQQDARVTLQGIIAEFRQGIADGSDQPATGFRSISPAVGSTPLLLPNANAMTASTLTFTLPSPDHYDPSLTGWSATDSSNYRRIRYYTQGADLHREQVSWASGGIVADLVDDVVIAPSSHGSVQFSAQYLSPTSVSIRLVVREGAAVCTLAQTVQVVVR